jgi:hypothetical protein
MGALANARRGLLSTNHLRLYLLCLLAQPSPQAWTAARKLAVAESGSRKPPPSDWGLWAHAAAARLGDEAIDAGAFAHHAGWGGSPHRANADRLVLAACLGHEPAKWGPAEVDAVVQHFESMGRTLWADLLRQAAARFGWAVPAHTRPGNPWGVAYFGGPRGTWRDALAAIAAVFDEKVGFKDAAAILGIEGEDAHIRGPGEVRKPLCGALGQGLQGLLLGERLERLGEALETAPGGRIFCAGGVGGRFEEWPFGHEIGDFSVGAELPVEGERLGEERARGHEQAVPL